MIAPGLAGRVGRRLHGIAAQPFVDVIVIELLGPQHAGQRLALYVPLVSVSAAGCRAA